MSEVRIAAEPRTEFGKGAARRTRRAGKVPAVLYGHGEGPRHLALPSRDFEHALRTDAGANVLLELQLGDGRELALAKAIQRDPLNGRVEHVDLLLVRRGERVVVDVPVVTTGDVASGGLLDLQLTAVSLEVEATNIPQPITLALDELEVGATVHAGDLPLPDGAELRTDPAAAVVHVAVAQTAEQFEAELAEAEAELGAGAAGAAAEAEAKAAAEGAAAGDEPTGEGDIVPDTASGEGGPAEDQTPRE